MTGFFYDLLYTLPIASILAYTYYIFFGKAEEKIFFYIVTFAAAILSIVVKHVKGKWKIVVGVFFVVAVAGVFMFRPEETRAVFFAEHIWILIAVGVGLAAVLSGLFTARFLYVKYVCSLGFVAYMVVSLVKKYDVTSFEVSAVALICLLTLSETVEKYWKKREETNARLHLVYVSPFIVAAVVALAVIPTSDKPFEWKEAKTVYSWIKEGYIIVTQNVLKGNVEGYIDVYSTFSEDGELHPDITTKDKRVMELETSIYSPRNVYLTGLVYDTFNGRGWVSTIESNENDKLIDAIETMYSVEQFDSEHSGDYYKVIQARNTYTYFKTKYLFVPLKTISIECVDEKYTYKNVNDRLIFDKFQGYGTKYLVSYVTLNTKNDCFAGYVNAPHEYSRESYDTFIARSYYKQFADVTYDDLLNHRDFIYDTYLPDTQISDRATAYYDEVTAEAETDYDKLTALAKELSTYTYTKHPGAFPEYIDSEEEFLDYFLFESKKGFCTYFATAFIIMARAQGIPARYAEGYSATVKSSALNDIKSYHAHAWPEAYIDGVGWIAFEPTGGGAASTYVDNGWQTSEEKDRIFAEAKENAKKKEENSDKPVVSEEIIEEEKEPFNFLFIIIPTAAALVLGALFVVLERLVSEKRLASMDLQTRIKILSKTNIKMLKYLGYKMEEGETLDELGKKVKEGMPEFENDFLILYEKALYSDASLTTNDLETVSESAQKLYSKLKFKHKIRMFLAYRA